MQLLLSHLIQVPSSLEELEFQIWFCQIGFILFCFNLVSLNTHVFPYLQIAAVLPLGPNHPPVCFSHFGAFFFPRSNPNDVIVIEVHQRIYQNGKGNLKEIDFIKKQTNKNKEK